MCRGEIVNLIKLEETYDKIKVKENFADKTSWL